jgi:TrmH RNA methyltransferase
MVPEAELEKIYGSPHHGGLVAITIPKPEHLLTAGDFALLKDLGPVHFVLDGIGNPHNIGAIARSLAFFGFKSLILSDDPRQAGLSDAAYRVAEGGLEILTLYRAEGLQNFLEDARQSFRVTGTTLSAQAQSLKNLTRTPSPRLILLGNEEEGLSARRLKSCDDLLTISGSGEIQSLNVAQTAAILGYAFQPSSFDSKPTSRSSPRNRPKGSGAGRKAETLPRRESGNIPKGPAPRVAPQKKQHSPQGSRPGTKNPSR